MNMIVERLSQLRALKKEIELEKQRLDKLMQLATYGSRSGPAAIAVQGGEVSDRTGKFAAEIAFLRELLRQNMERALCELLRMQQFIDSIDDAELRCVFKMRYFKGYTWRRIADEFGELDDTRLRKRHDRYLDSPKNRHRILQLAQPASLEVVAAGNMQQLSLI